MRHLAKDLTIEIDPTHNFFLVNGRRDIYLAMILTTLKAYLVSILDRNEIENPYEVATQSILNGKIVDDHIHIDIPPEMKNGGNEDKWKIFMTIEGSHDFFMHMMFP